jgi:hypothetical protein
MYRLIILPHFNSCKAVQNTLVPGTDMQNVYAVYVQSDKQTIYVRPFPENQTEEFLNQFHESLCKVIVFQKNNTRILRKVGKHYPVEQVSKHFFSYVAHRNARKVLPKEIKYFDVIEAEMWF